MVSGARRSCGRRLSLAVVVVAEVWLALARTRGIRRCTRRRRTNSHKEGGKGRSGFTSIGRRSQAAAQVVAVVNGNDDLGHEQAKERCQQVHKIILSIIV